MGVRRWFLCILFLWGITAWSCSCSLRLCQFPSGVEEENQRKKTIFLCAFCFVTLSKHVQWSPVCTSLSLSFVPVRLTKEGVQRNESFCLPFSGQPHMVLASLTTVISCIFPRSSHWSVKHGEIVFANTLLGTGNQKSTQRLKTRSSLSSIMFRIQGCRSWMCEPLFLFCFSSLCKMVSSRTWILVIGTDDVVFCKVIHRLCPFQLNWRFHYFLSGFNRIKSDLDKNVWCCDFRNFGPKVVDVWFWSVYICQCSRYFTTLCTYSTESWCSCGFLKVSSEPRFPAFLFHHAVFHSRIYFYKTFTVITQE